MYINVHQCLHCMCVTFLKTSKRTMGEDPNAARISLTPLKLLSSLQCYPWIHNSCELIHVIQKEGRVCLLIGGGCLTYAMSIHLDMRASILLGFFTCTICVTIHHTICKEEEITTKQKQQSEQTLLFVFCFCFCFCFCF